MEFSRENPSPRYRELMRLYRQLHAEGEKFLGLGPAATYPGISLMPHLETIKQLIDETGAKTILDYGSGKGMQYEPQRIVLPGRGEWDSVLDFWDVDEVRCYDPCYEPYSRLPHERFDGVVCTDVLEHCPEEDLRWIADEMFSFAARFVYAGVACYPARSRLPTGENAHCTVRPSAWWRRMFEEVAAGHPAVKWKISCVELDARDE
jgi:hypothetical protein